jgi:hypothetical protein
MARPKGQPKLGGGSRKGIPNKNTAALKEMILQALDGAGGVEYLQKQAKANPAAFLTLIGKVLPLQAQVSGEMTIQWPVACPPVQE